MATIIEPFQVLNVRDQWVFFFKDIDVKMWKSHWLQTCLEIASKSSSFDKKNFNLDY